MCEDYASTQKEGRPKAQSAGSVTTQSIAFKYEKAFEPYRYTRHVKKVMAGLPNITIYFF
jgi:hypothetical protein